MLTRIVKMTFQPDEIDQFLSVFNHYKTRIRHSEGCLHLALLQDANSAHIFYTYSHWEAASYLEKYRQSSLFKEVWGKTKLLFQDKPEAFSAQEVMKVT
ncbi:MAG: putative quinol monooxygenase [Thermonemataceae bacterium]